MIPSTQRALARPIDYVGRFRMLGHVFGFRTNVPCGGDVMDRLFASFQISEIPSETRFYELLELDHGASSEPRYGMFFDDEPISRVSSPGLLLDWLIGNATAEAVTNTTAFAAIHASAASFDRRAFIFPAPREHGKTTTIAALVRAGWDFLTDEAALISLEDGRVHPFPRPLRISPRSMGVLPGLKEGLPRSYEPFRHFDFHVAPDDLRKGCLSEPVPVRFVVFPEYGDGAATALAPIPRAEALVELLSGCFNLPRLGPKGPAVLGDVVRDAACYRLSIGAIEPAVELIQGLFEEPLAEVATV